MTTRIWSFLPDDMLHVPPAINVESAVMWLRGAMPAYQVVAVDHGHVAFFDCGGNMGATYCPHCNVELAAEGWSSWMTADYDEKSGFHFTTRAMPCCGKTATLDQIVFENPCMFGRFAIQVTDTMRTYSDEEIARFADELGKHLQCKIRYLAAHY